MTPSIRISLGIVALTSSLLLTIDWVLDIFPSPYASALESRQDLAESLAIQYSSLVSNNRGSEMHGLMESVVAQMDEVLSLKLLRSEGEVLAQTDEHSARWNDSHSQGSTTTQVLVPIYQGAKRWGTLQIKFEPLSGGGIAGLFSTPLYKLVGAMSVAGFLVYLLFLSRTLRYLDPASVVPSRVRSALDQLVEGVFILDHDQQIVLCNRAFASHLAVAPDDMIGIDPSELPWDERSITDLAGVHPWTLAIRDGARQTEQRMKLNSKHDGVRILSTNVSPIVDGGGNQRGVMASFNDITDLERANEGLKEALSVLESANADIQIKNAELYRLATIDPLTECLNRRAFFEKLEAEFDLARSEQLDLCVVMADIDHFKSINDEFGHGTGDVVIKDMASALMGAASINDYVGRYGGEEFCLVLVGSSIEDAKQRSDQVRLAFEALYGAAQSVTGGRVITASFGVSSVHFGAEDVAHLLNQADEALYESKNNGRNQVTHWMPTELDNRKAS